MRACLLVLALAGCDAVFGLDDSALPRCVGSDFDGATADAMQTLEVFSFTGDGERAVASIGGILYELDGKGQNPRVIDIEPLYGMVSAAFEPNGDFFFFTAAIEPPEIFALAQQAGKWQFDQRVPQGYIAGTPTNRMSGKPVRVVVRLDVGNRLFQEYERAGDGSWKPVRARFELPAFAGANLTQDGLALVFDGLDANEARGVYIAQRPSLDAAFAAPQLVLDGGHLHPQLFDDCGTLYVVDDNTLTRYVR